MAQPPASLGPTPSLAQTLVQLARRVARAFRRRRRLRATSSGRVLIGMTFAVGFAAFNTGNNLLFFGWGLLLSAILVSGILSESTLSSVQVALRGVDEAFAGTSSTLALSVENVRRLPAFALDLSAQLLDPKGQALRSARAFELRVSALQRRDVVLHLLPRRRGSHQLQLLLVRTAFPFGFFEKEKPVHLDPPVEIVVGPAWVDVEQLLRTRLARFGETPARRQGMGDELFSLRPHRVGDDPRRIAWRRSAKTGRFVVRENEADESRDILIDLCTRGAAPADAERALEVAHALARALLERGNAVGLRAPGKAVACARGPRQRSAISFALALCAFSDPDGELHARRALVLAVVARGAAAPARADDVIEVAA